MVTAQETIRDRRRTLALDVSPSIRGLQAVMDAIMQTDLRSFGRSYTPLRQTNSRRRNCSCGIVEKLPQPLISGIR